MEALKIIFMLLFFSCYCNGHFRRYNINRESPAFPSLNFQTFPEYFKPLYRIRYLSPSTTSANNLHPHTPKPTRININKKQTTPLKQHNSGLLSIINKAMKPLMGRKEYHHEMLNQPQRGLGPMFEHHRNHAIHLKLIPKLIKKEVAKQLGTIFGKMQKDTVANNTKEVINKIEESKVNTIDLTNNKESTSEEHPKLNEIDEDEIKKKTGYINKIEAKSIFGNFVGNKHFANIFIFYPNNDNSALVVGLKDNSTESFTENPAEILTKTPIDKLVDRTTEHGINDDDKDIVGTKDSSSKDKAEITVVPTKVAVTTDSTILTSDATLTTTGIAINQDKDNKNTGDDEDYLTGDKDNSDEAVKDNDSKTTEDDSMTSVSIVTTESFYTKKDDTAVVEELTVSPSSTTENPDIVKDDISTEAPITVVNEVSESSSESVTDSKGASEDDKIIIDEDISENEDKIKENDINSTVIPTTILNQATESTIENLTEKLNETKEEDNQGIDEFHDTIKETTAESTVDPNESTVATDTIIEAYTSEDANVTSTEVPTSSESHVEDATNTKSESNTSSDSTTESTTIDLSETFATGNDISTTENFDNTLDLDKSFTETTDSDYMEVEYTYF